MIDAPCLGCGRPAVHRHHPEGRDADAAYFSPPFTIPLCLRCHNLVHVARRHAGLDDLADPFAGLRRIAHDLALCGEWRRGAGLVLVPTPSLLEAGLAIAASLDRVPVR